MSHRNIETDHTSSLMDVIAQQLRIPLTPLDPPQFTLRPTLSTPMAALPSRETAQNLIERFFEYCSCFQPVLHQDQIAAE